MQVGTHWGKPTFLWESLMAYIQSVCLSVSSLSSGISTGLGINSMTLKAPRETLQLQRFARHHGVCDCPSLPSCRACHEPLSPVLQDR